MKKIQSKEALFTIDTDYQSYLNIEIFISSNFLKFNQACHLTLINNFESIMTNIYSSYKNSSFMGSKRMQGKKELFSLDQAQTIKLLKC